MSVTVTHGQIHLVGIGFPVGVFREDVKGDLCV